MRLRLLPRLALPSTTASRAPSSAFRALASAHNVTGTSGLRHAPAMERSVLRARGLSTSTSRAQALADQADFPRDAMEMIEAHPDPNELVTRLEGEEDSTEILNAMVEQWMDPEINAGILEAGASDLLDAFAEGDEETADGLDKTIEEAMEELGIEFDQDEDGDEDGDDAELEMVETEEGGEYEANPLARGLSASDWRRLQAQLQAQDAADSSRDENLELKHPWFKTRRLAEGVTLPLASEAGSDPLLNVFDMTVEAPPKHHQAYGRHQMQFPGQQLNPTVLNPQRFPRQQTQRPRGRPTRLVRKRFCPFQTGRVQMPDHKQVGTVSRFLSEGGQILPRRRTGISAKNQRKFAKVVKRARHFGLIPTTSRLQRPQF
eukprot:TRINITY_DN28867_c0_g1_i1.p1 TRINITY_DN28867_c0_g1~~TRINITY_DN28867_c0_g1_i1.p1  ORF type:complete len:376 (+),score=76.10 TRINITY_DN28867_c0_g1_i1:201-1328(+)